MNAETTTAITVRHASILSGDRGCLAFGSFALSAGRLCEHVARLVTDCPSVEKIRPYAEELLTSTDPWAVALVDPWAIVHAVAFGWGCANPLPRPLQTGTNPPEYDIDILVRYTGSALVAVEYKTRSETPPPAIESLSAWESHQAHSAGAGFSSCSSPTRAVARAKDISTRLSTATEISEDDAIETAYDQIYKHVHLGEEGFRAIDSFLSAINPKRFGNSVLLSILTITALPEVRQHLPTRLDFFAKVTDLLAAREGEPAASDLLAGLE